MLSGHFVEVEFDGNGDLVDFELFDLNETTNERESCSIDQVPENELTALLCFAVGNPKDFWHTRPDVEKMIEALKAVRDNWEHNLTGAMRLVNAALVGL
jgi:hypothetical protein